ncbi:unnamed protein product [Danaus chrysippus]|uniref:(African queen) hypothetical protein n=1 Tax=Danaus chrysippus TaxID=151541 RepID=A0A8J2W963_9NEOP|nr:unnamed protein product [Danaus chrysippus]
MSISESINFGSKPNLNFDSINISLVEKKKDFLYEPSLEDSYSVSSHEANSTVLDDIINKNNIKNGVIFVETTGVNKNLETCENSGDKENLKNHHNSQQPKVMEAVENLNKSIQGSNVENEETASGVRNEANVSAAQTDNQVQINDAVQVDVINSEHIIKNNNVTNFNGCLDSNDKIVALNNGDGAAVDGNGGGNDANTCDVNGSNVNGDINKMCNNSNVVEKSSSVLKSETASKGTLVLKSNAASKNTSTLRNKSAIKSKILLKKKPVLKNKPVLKSKTVLKDKKLLKINSITKNKSTLKNNVNKKFKNLQPKKIQSSNVTDQTVLNCTSTNTNENSNVTNKNDDNIKRNSNSQRDDNIENDANSKQREDAVKKSSVETSESNKKTTVTKKHLNLNMTADIKKDSNVKKNANITVKDSNVKKNTVAKKDSNAKKCLNVKKDAKTKKLLNVKKDDIVLNGEVAGKTGEDICQQILEKLSVDDLDIGQFRSQSYDNGSNIASIHKGVQARIAEKNELAEFVPCLAQSINLKFGKKILARSDALMDGVLKTLQKMRQNPMECWIKEAGEVAEKCGVDPIMQNKRIQKRKKQFDEMCEDELPILQPV